MSWLSGDLPKTLKADPSASWLERRPIVLLEDHLYHIGDFLTLLSHSSPDVLGLLTVVCLDRPGPDTLRSVAGWLAEYPTLHVVAARPAPPAHSAAHSDRWTPLPASAFEHSHELSKEVARHLRAGGLLLQDVQLETLAFVPRDRWWESIFIAASVRGLFAERPPSCLFLSNKRGYEATFGSDLLSAGFDPRDVLDKNELPKLLPAALGGFFARSMPLNLAIMLGAEKLETVVGDNLETRDEVENALDLVWWQDAGGCLAIGGRAVKIKHQRRHLELKSSSCESSTWQALVDDAFADRRGVPVLDVGRRIAPDLAGRAEMTNCAARHIHQLRSRLVDSSAIQTVAHAYRLDPRLRVGRARVRDSLYLR